MIRSPRLGYGASAPRPRKPSPIEIVVPGTGSGHLTHAARAFLMRPSNVAAIGKPVPAPGRIVTGQPGAVLSTGWTGRLGVKIGR